MNTLTLADIGQDAVSPHRVELREYQHEAVAAIQDAAAQRGVRRQIVALPTGTGKTVIFVELIRQTAGRALILVHRDELVTQALAKLAMAGLAEAVGVVKAERDEIGKQVLLASVQTLSRPARLARCAQDFELVIVDEAHHATAESYRRILDHLGVFGPDGPLLVGVTATPERADGTSLDEVFQAIVYRRDLVEMIRAGYLCDLRAKQIHLEADFGALHTRAGDFIEGESEALLLAANAPMHIVQAYTEHAAGRTALIFTPTVHVAHAVATAFGAASIAAEAVDAGTPLEKRRAMLARFHRGETRVLANCAVLTEGYDEPRVDCVVIARPTKSRPLYVQMIGRGTRKSPGKADLLILDVVGATTRHDLVTAATLVGQPELELEDGLLAALDAAEQQEQARAAEALAVEQRGRLVAQEVDVFTRRLRHRFAWVPVAGMFVLSTGDGHLELAERAGTWSVTHRRRQLGASVLASGLNLEYAQGVAEDHVRQLGAAALVDPAAPWRSQPATAKQLAALRRCRLRTTATMTKGEAADLLTAATAGFRR